MNFVPPGESRSASFLSPQLRPIIFFVSTVLFTFSLPQRGWCVQAPQISNELTALSAIDEAINSSPQARAARFERDGALARTFKDRPSVNPTLTATAEGGIQGPRLKYPGLQGADTTVLPEEAGRLDIVLEQLLYHEGGKEARQRFDAQVALVQLDYRKALMQIAFNVERLLLDLRRAQSAVRIAQEGMTSASRYREQVQNLISSGSAKPVDLQTADALAAEATAGLTQANSAETLARLAINQALGRPVDGPMNLNLGLDARAAPLPAPARSATDAALRQRLELMELQLELVAARAGIGLARSQSRPSLSVRGQLTEQTPSAFVHEHYGAAMIQIKLPVLDNGKTKLDVREAEAEVKRLGALIDDARAGITLDVLRAWTRIQDAQARGSLADTQTNAVITAEKVTETAYSVGRATVFEVQSAQREVRLAREKQVAAAIDLYAALDDYSEAQGIAPASINSAAPMPALPGAKR